jgi:hypothetical protein
MHGFSDQMAAPDRRGVSSLIERLREEQAEANLALAPLVEEQSLAAIRESLNELITAAREEGR